MRNVAHATHLETRPAGNPKTRRRVWRADDLCPLPLRPRNEEALQTVELIVEEVEWIPRPRPRAATDIVHIRLKYSEQAIRKSVKLLGGHWHPETKTWRIAYGATVALRLTDRIVQMDDPPASLPIPSTDAGA